MTEYLVLRFIYGAIRLTEPMLTTYSFANAYLCSIAAYSALVA